MRCLAYSTKTGEATKENSQTLALHCLPLRRSSMPREARNSVGSTILGASLAPGSEMQLGQQSLPRASSAELESERESALNFGLAYRAGHYFEPKHPFSICFGRSRDK